MSYKSMKENIIKKVIDVMSCLDEVASFVNGLDEITKRDKEMFNTYVFELKLKLMTIK